MAERPERTKPTAKADGASRGAKGKRRPASREAATGEAGDTPDAEATPSGTAADGAGVSEPIDDADPGAADHSSEAVDDSTDPAGPTEAGSQVDGAVAAISIGQSPPLASGEVTDPTAGDSTQRTSAGASVDGVTRAGGAAQDASGGQVVTSAATDATAEAGAPGPQEAGRSSPTDLSRAQPQAAGAKTAPRRQAEPQQSDSAADPADLSAGASPTAGLPGDGTAVAGDIPDAGAFQQFADALDATAGHPNTADPGATTPPDLASRLGQAAAPHPGGGREAGGPAAPAARDPAADVAPEARFADDNHERIVAGVRGELLPNGGSMRLRLDPPELGSLQVALHLRDGVVTASFQTGNEETARLLSHTLGDLRSTLEAHGIAVDKLHVQQAPRDDHDGNPARDGQARDGSGRPGQPFDGQQESARDQRRKEMVQKLWDKLAGKSPIDVLA